MQLQDVCELDRRTVPASEAIGQGLDFVGMEHVDPLTGTISKGAGSRTGEGKGQAFLFDERHVLFGKLRPYLRKIALPERAGCSSTELVPLLPDAAKLDRKYLFHWVRRQSVINTLMEKNTGARMPRADMKVLLGFDVNLPSIKEQQNIAALLDRAVEIRQRADVSRANARAMISAIFEDMFGNPAANPKGWSTSKLGESCDFVGGSSLKNGVAFDDQLGGYIHCKVSTLALERNAAGVDAAVEWSEEPVARSSLAPAGSIVFPKRGAAIATNRKRLLNRDACLDPNLMGVFGKPSVYEPRFLLGLFNSFELMSIASGSTVPQLNKQDLDPLTFIVPPLPLQQQFVVLAQATELISTSLDAAALKAEKLAEALSAQIFE